MNKQDTVMDTFDRWVINRYRVLRKMYGAPGAWALMDDEDRDNVLVAVINMRHEEVWS